MANIQDLCPGEFPTFPQEKEKIPLILLEGMTTSTWHKRILMQLPAQEHPQHEFCKESWITISLFLNLILKGIILNGPG